MCGILSILNFNNDNIDHGLVLRMRDTMYHRGPDDAGVYMNGAVALAHRRLSIIDLSESGHQPMSNEDNSIILVCNGEIYNYVELKEDLKKRGHRFKSTSDSEIIIHQYEEDGEKCLEKFNGMFSFVLWDKKKRKLFAARDRLGIKPLYYFYDGKRIIIASEIKAILEDATVSRVPNYEALADYIFASRALGSKSMFEKINEVEPGYMVTVDRQRGDVKVKKYWDLEFNYNTSRSLDDVKEELFFLLDDAVKVHCRSDAPLGCHLSGGMDTSIIVALAARYRENMNTFSIKFSDEPYIDETKYAKAVASKAGTQYQEGYPSAANMATLLPILQWHMDAPMATDGGFSYFTVSHLARESVKVTLTGHGGDEVFAGYPAQFYASYNTTEMFKQQLDPNRIAPIQQGNKIIEKYLQKGFKGIYKSVIKRFFTGRESLEDLWIKLHCGNLPEDNVFLQQSFINSLQGYSPRDDYVKPLKENNAEYTLDKCLYHDLRIYLPGLLHLEDRASMALSLESRVPIIDYRIVEFLATIPPEQKVVDLKPKYLLREIGSSLLPDIVRKREDKSGFKVPGKFWFTPEVKDFVKNILLSSDSLNRGIFKENVLKAAYDAPSNLLTWNIMNIELWFKIFIDRDPNWTDKTGLENLPSIHKS